MRDYIRDLRFIPIAVTASAGLLALTAADLVLDRNASAPPDVVRAGLTDRPVIHVTPGAARQSDSKRSWAQQMFNFPGSRDAPAPAADHAPIVPIAPPVTDKDYGDIITGSVPDSNEAKSEPKPKSQSRNEPKSETPAAKSDAAGAKKDGKSDQNPKPPVNGTLVPLNDAPGPSAAERTILERLQERRQELDKRSRELDIREGLIAEAEKRVEAKLAEIKEAKAQLATATMQKDEAEAARFKSLVTMYETMKPRDAAKIFDRLETSVLIEVASQINPRAMSEILAQMSPETAQHLTVELASRAKAVTKDPNADLPKIEGHPTTTP